MPTGPMSAAEWLKYLRQTGIPAGFVTDALSLPRDVEYLTIGQVANILGVSEKTVRRRVHDGTLPPPEKFGRLSRWRRLDIENLNGKYS